MIVYHSLHDCYRAIVRNEDAPALNYAVNYAKHGLTLPDARKHEELNDESRVQALYVRSNLTSWRGDEAKAVRTSLDKIIGKK